MLQQLSTKDLRAFELPSRTPLQLGAHPLHDPRCRCCGHSGPRAEIALLAERAREPCEIFVHGTVANQEPPL
eukprot:1929579-Pyramimonas_sp.AAC.1